MPKSQVEGRTDVQQNAGLAVNKDRTYSVIYALLLAMSIGIWLLPIRSGLSLDETGSYWQISAGFSHIWSRGSISLCFPTYPYILWLATKVLGTSEIALRIPSVLAMLGAVYLLYLAGRELFGRDAGIFTAIAFSIHYIVAFAAVDTRPYAFAALATNAAILALLRLRNDDSNRGAALFGVLAASILYFHLLFGVVFPAFVVCFFLIKTGERKAVWRQFGIATAAIAVACLPLIPGVEYVLHTSGSHVYEKAPRVSEAIETLFPGWSRATIAGAAVILLLLFLARKRRQTSAQSQLPWQDATRPLLACASLGLIPLLILYAVSRGTSIHMFAERHRLVAIPGIALCWGFIISRIPQRALQLLLCAVFLGGTAYRGVVYYPWHHLPSSKYALEAAEKNNPQGSPVLYCSPFIEGDYDPMPARESVKDSPLFAPLGYYKLSAPVVPLPRDLNPESIRLGSEFLQEATQKHERFLAVGEAPSQKNLDWLKENASGAFDVRTIGVYEGMSVLEFTPRAKTDARQ